jgi:hypothetical protein
MKQLIAAVLLSGTAWAQGQVAHAREDEVAKSRRFEVSLFPGAVQLNGRFTQHVGTFGALTWHLREGFALQFLGGGNWHAVESAFNGELVEKYRVRPQAASSLLWAWGLFGGFEVEPLVAELSFGEGSLAHVGFVLNVGAGAGGTSHQLRPQTDRPATYGDTGVRFMSTFALGARLSLGERFTVRLEVRDVAYSARVTEVNGCTRWDAESLRPDEQYPLVSPSCRGFGPGIEGARDGWAAGSLITRSGSDLVHNAGLYLGAGFVF